MGRRFGREDANGDLVYAFENLAGLAGAQEPGDAGALNEFDERQLRQEPDRKNVAPIVVVDLFRQQTGEHRRLSFSLAPHERRLSSRSAGAGLAAGSTARAPRG